MRALVLLYLLVATLFAFYTPDWQVPDEPAHYNYIRQLALGGGLPVLTAGDYCQPCLDDLLAAQFPAGMSIEGIRYESHQPPLYYLLAVPIFLAFGGALLPLRLFSVVLGALLAVLAARVVDRALYRLPAASRHALALGAAAVVALLPQHVAMLAGVNNDALAEVLLAALLLNLTRRPLGVGGAVLTGVLLGLGFWTKATAYVGVGLVALAVVLRARADRRAWRDGALSLGLAALIGLPWWIRNIAVYGGLDFLGLQNHNRIALAGGQPATADWLAAFGLPEVLRRMAQTTHQSFWGQFGWMGVVLDARIYYVLAMAVALGLWGLLLYAAGWRRLAGLPADTRRALALLGGLAVFTAATYAWYNLTFVQHQGRYLYPALIPLALGLVAGWRRVLRGAWREIAGGALWAAAAGAAWYLLAGLDMLRWALALWAGLVGLVAAARVARRWIRPDTVFAPAVALGLAALGLASLFAVVLPQLLVAAQ